MYFKIAPTAIEEIERLYRINEDVLRFVTVKYDSKREVKAWNDLVVKTEKATEARAAAAARAAAPKEEAAPAAATPAPEAPVAETPAPDAPAADA